MRLANAIGAISALNECANFFQWAKSFISSLHTQWSVSQEQDSQDLLLHLQSDLQRLRDTLPTMYNLIDVAEWRSHEHCVAELLPKLKDTVYDADDLLDEFRWHEMNVELEGNENTSPFTDFVENIIQGSFNKLNDVLGRLDHLSRQLENMGLREVTQRFDKLVRPETSSLPNEDKIFGRDDEMKRVMGLLGVPADSKRKRATSPTSTSSTSPSERFGDMDFLEELEVRGCPNISTPTLVSPSLKRLVLGDCGCLLVNIDCCSLTEFIIAHPSVTSIQPQMWSLPTLQELKFSYCNSLISIGVSTTLPLGAGTDSIRAVSKLTSFEIEHCDELLIVDGLFTEEYLHAVERIHVRSCSELISLPGERFGRLSSLKHLVIGSCPNLNWERGLVLPSSLQTLELLHCGGLSEYVPECLENLTSLVSLKIAGCHDLTSIPGSIWRTNLASLEELNIRYCWNLASIGGAEAVAKIKKVDISYCSKLKEAGQIRRR